MGLSVTNS